MNRASSIICSSAVFLLASVLCAQQKAEPSECIVLINTDLGEGTGFVCRLGGTNYIVTNAHVLEGAQKFEFRTINKGKLKGVQIDLANDRDMARILIDGSEQASLRPADAAPAIGKPITVLGNSQGMGAVTELKGTIRGMGPDVIEVDAPFVEGNSGSPILNADGQVFGVATFVAKPGITNWITEGTPFAGTRRFGVRLQGGIEWKPVSVRQFYAESSTLVDCDRFLYDSSRLVEILRTGNLAPLGHISARLKNPDSPRYFDPDFARVITQFCDSLKSAETSYKQGRNERSSSVSAPLRAATMTFQQFPQVPLRKLRQMKWSTKHYEKMAKEYEKVFSEWK